MLDPSYIRSIRDGILIGNIEANNTEDLPEGLVGLYDKELFPPSIKWNERKETLQFFLVFALAQKEISADFVAKVLGDEWYAEFDHETSKEEYRLKKVNYLIQLHSKLFNAGGGGKFRLYHERFRLYILQKVSEGDLTQFNQLFISLCESELKNNTEKDIPEKESYALEFLSTHYFISAMQGEKVCLNKKDAVSLKKLAYDQAYWERQVKASKGFELSKKMLNEMMSWASKFDEEEVIECALNKVDLYHLEQNDAPRIVQLVSNGDVETALQRIEAFGGNDQEGLQLKFILYMLCLMELTLNESNKKRKKAKSIERILRDLEGQNLFYNLEFFDWSIFFPEIIIMQMFFEWKKMNIDADFIFNMTYEIDNDWFCTEIPLTENKIIKNKFKEKDLIKLTNSKTKKSIDLIIEIFHKKKSSRISDDCLDEQLSICYGIESYNFLEDKYLKNEFISELMNIDDWFYLSKTINKLFSKDLSNKNEYVKNIFLNKFNSLSKEKRLLLLNVCSNLVSNYSWDEFIQKINKINLDDSDTAHYQAPYNNNIKKKLIKYVLIRKWLRNDNDFYTFVYDSMKQTVNSEIKNINSSLLPYSSSEFLNKLLVFKKQFDAAFNLSPKELAYNFGKVYTTENNIKNLIFIIEKKELLDYRIYIMTGIADGFDTSINKNINVFINLTKDFPYQLSIIMKKIKTK